MFHCRGCDAYRNEVAALRAQLSDQTELAFSLQKQFAEERKQLLDRLLAAERPAALREVYRVETQREPGTPGRPNLPGMGRGVITRPPEVRMTPGKLSSGHIDPLG